MKMYLASAGLALALVSGPAFSQTASEPIDAPAAAIFTPPEGYVLESSWAGVTADHLKGADVVGPDGSSIGSVSDVVLGADGAVSGIVSDIGGFLGMGAHTVSLGTDQISLYKNGDGDIIIHSALSKDALQALPEYIPPT